MTSFEHFGKQAGDEQAKMECGICWHVYDPQEGDPVWQIPAGTAFSSLPDDWRCPNCDALQSKFMRLGDDGDVNER
jgi:rubredoxin